jgi:hypothetical protein
MLEEFEANPCYLRRHYDEPVVLLMVFGESFRTAMVRTIVQKEAALF